MLDIKIKISSIVIFLCVMFKYLIEYGFNMTILYGCLIAIILIEFLIIIKKQYFKDVWVKIIIFAVFTCVYVIAYKDVNLVITFLFALLLLKMDFKEFLKKFSIASIVMYVATIILYLIGILKDNALIRYTENGISYRHSLGFTSPNSVFLFFLPIVLSQYILFKNKNKFFFVFGGISIVLYGLSLSRTGMYCIVLLFIIDKILRKINLEFIKKIMPIFPLILFISSVLIAIYFGESKHNEFSILLSNRPYLWNQIITNCDIFTLFGSKAQLDVLLDNFYLAIVYRLGLFSVITYYYIYLCGLKGIKNYEVIVTIVIFLIYGIAESNTIIGSINFTLAILLKNAWEKKSDIDLEIKYDKK